MITDSTKVVGFSGFKGSGKTTAATMLASHIGAPVMHFADPIKEIVRNLDPFDSKGALLSTYMEIGGESVAKREHDTYRDYLRTIGEGVRKVDETVWVNALLRRAAGMPVIVVGDVRFPTERLACDILINITRNGVDSDGDETEQDMSAYADMHIKNDGEISDLAATIQNICDDFDWEPITYGN